MELNASGSTDYSPWSWVVHSLTTVSNPTHILTFCWCTRPRLNSIQMDQTYESYIYSEKPGGRSTISNWTFLHHFLFFINSLMLCLDSNSNYLN